MLVLVNLYNGIVESVEVKEQEKGNNLVVVQTEEQSTKGSSLSRQFFKREGSGGIWWNVKSGRYNFS